MRSLIVMKRHLRLVNAAVLLTFTIAIFFSSTRAHAFTCDDVRHLSAAEQNYWSKVLHLTSGQRHLIWVVCYRDYRPNSQQQIVRR